MLAALLLAAVRLTIAPHGSCDAVVLDTPQGEVSASAKQAALVPAGRVRVVRPAHCWSPAIDVDGETATLPVWPLAKLSGRFAGGENPKALSASFELDGLRNEARCTIENAAWRCLLPQTKLDVRLATEGFAPHYVWDAELPLEIGPWKPVRGASVSGWIASDAAGVEFDKATVRLVPLAYRAPADELRLMSYAATPTRRGFFQITGVQPGSWQLFAESRGVSPSRISDVETREEEIRLRDALVLRPLARLEVMVTPPTAPSGEPWRVRLYRREHSYLQPSVQAVAGTDGHWTREAVEAGQYSLHILDETEAVFANHDIAIEPGPVALPVAITSVAVKGRVHIGDRGIQAQLTFRSYGGQSVHTASNEDGALRVLLPAEGEWMADVRLASGQNLSARVDVERGDDLDIGFPGGTISGRTVDEDGQPVIAGVIVTVGKTIVADIRSDARGEFEIVGIEEGPAVIDAATPEAWAPRTSVLVSESTPVTLTVRKPDTVIGWLATPAGQPVVGAMITYWYDGALGTPRTYSSPSGRFSLRVDPAAVAVNLAIVAPGMPAKLTALRGFRDVPRVDITMTGVGGTLVVATSEGTPPFPHIVHDGVSASLHHVFPEWRGAGMPPYLTPDGWVVSLEAGDYAVCTASCVTATVLPNAKTQVTAPRRAEQETRK